MDTKLLSDLKKNSDAILDIMERNGVDVSKYRKISEEQKAKEKHNKEKAKVYRQNYKNSATAFLRNFAYAGIKAKEKQRNKDDLQTLKACCIAIQN